MPNANWQAEVNAALAEQKQEEAKSNDIFRNPALARFCVASGILSGLICAALVWASKLPDLSLDTRTTFGGAAWIAGMMTVVEIGLGITALLTQPKPRTSPSHRNEPGHRLVGRV